MGNAVQRVSCFASGSEGPIKLVFWGGATELLRQQQPAGELMFRFSDCIVCPADAFFIGRPVPALAIDDDLLPGRTYLVIPLGKFPCHGNPLTAASVASLSSTPRAPLAGCPFAYVKGGDGRAMIKVLPEFMTKLVVGGGGADEGRERGDGGKAVICTTPELRKHFAQLVGPKERPWSPKLETIAERKKRLLLAGSLSPVRLLGLTERKTC
ncbi:uncharacterized protein LOC122004115 [Zingiber officinale]|uniref:uncharacterized protein LOC122004115 n=1 Tax=Zingiber officinale TaxID=94328 RepID=UPI001C4C8D96|nr:uncharacterized protein LOC122004115 [Zingiber officinale]